MPQSNDSTERCTAFQEILGSLLRSACEINENDLFQLRQISQKSWLDLSHALAREFNVIVTAAELESCDDLGVMSSMVMRRLDQNSRGRTIIDTYLVVAHLAKDEYHPKIDFHWCAEWESFLNVGNWFTRPEGLDSVELVLRLEQECGIPISDADAASMKTVGQTVRYLWQRNC